MSRQRRAIVTPLAGWARAATNGPSHGVGPSSTSSGPRTSATDPHQVDITRAGGSHRAVGVLGRDVEHHAEQVGHAGRVGHARVVDEHTGEHERRQHVDARPERSTVGGVT